MMESFFKDLVCHGDYNGNDSFNDSNSEGESPQHLPRSGTMVMTKTHTTKALEGRRSSNRSLQKRWGSIGSDENGQIPVWEDVEPLDRDEQAKLDHIEEVSKHLKERGALEDLDDFDFPPRDPAITRIPKHKRLSFPDENEGVNTVRAGYNPDTDRCKAMDIATKQAALREIEARRMLAPKQSPGLGAQSQPPKSSNTPRTSSSGKLGFGTSSRRLDSLPTPPMHSSRADRRPSPLPSPRALKRCDIPEAQRGPGAPSPSPLQHSKSSVPLTQKPQGSSHTPRATNDHLTTPMWGAPSTPQRQSPSSMKSPSFVLAPGPPRCPSMASLSPQSSRPAPNGTGGGEKRRNSYVQRQESFSVSGSNNAMDAYAYADSERQRLLARFLPVQNNSYVAPPSPTYSFAPPVQTNGNSWVPPPSLSRSNSYVPPPQSSAHAPRAPPSPRASPSPRPVAQAMVVSGSCQKLALPEIQYPNSMEKVKDAGLAMCARLFAPPPPRMLSFEGPPAVGFESMHSHRAVAAPPSPGPPRRMMCAAPPSPRSCERSSPSPQPASSTSAFPFSLPSAPPPLPTFSFEAMLSPFVQRANSYEPPLIRH